MNKRGAEYYINAITIILVCALGVVGFHVLNLTAKSNSITVDVAKHQSEKESRMVQEMRLMTLEIRNLQKEVGIIRDEIEKK